MRTQIRELNQKGATMARKLLEALEMGATPSVFLTVVDKKKFTFKAKQGAALESADDICDITGKLKRFADVDTVIAAILKINPSATKITFEVDVAGVRVPKLPSDVVADAVSRKAGYEARKTKATAIRTALAANLAAISSYQNSPDGAKAAYYAEQAAEFAAVEGAIVYLNDAIADANAIINPPVNP